MTPRNTPQLLVAIPAYKPGPELIGVVDELLRNLGPITNIIVIDDGSGQKFLPVFEALAPKPKVAVLRHEVNQGKGQALKTAFAYIRENFPEAAGVVTADADGQHLPKDIKAVAECLVANPRALILGARQFSRHSTPWHNRQGNKITAKVMSLFFGLSTNDTQTGLRGLPFSFLAPILTLKRKSYAFELEMLIKAGQSGLTTIDVPIEAVYLDDNKSSHFNVVVDSFKIYSVIFKHVGNSIITAALDYLIFALLFALGVKIFTAMLVARLMALAFNFTVGKRVVFKSRHPTWPEILKYSGLAVCLFAASYLGVAQLKVAYNFSPYYSKILVEGGIFIISFIAQRYFIFKNN